jgi:hypothetical protein
MGREYQETFGRGVPVIAGMFAGKFFWSSLTAQLASNPDNLMVDQNGEVVKTGLERGDTYFAFAPHIPPSPNYPDGKRNEFLDVLERNSRALARGLRVFFDANPGTEVRLPIVVVGGEMKHPRARNPDRSWRWTDYSPYALEDFRRYVEARWADFEDFKRTMGIPAERFSTVWELMPPRSTDPNAETWNRLDYDTNHYMRHWHEYRLWAIAEHVLENVRWFKEEGLRGPYWSSQAVNRTGDMAIWRAMEPRSLNIPGVVPGVSLYGDTAIDESLLQQVHRYTEPYLADGLGWVSMQWNPWEEGKTKTAEEYLDVMRLNEQYGVQGWKVHGERPEEFSVGPLIEPTLLGAPDSACAQWMEGS